MQPYNCNLKYMFLPKYTTGEARNKRMYINIIPFVSKYINICKKYSPLSWLFIQCNAVQQWKASEIRSPVGKHFGGWICLEIHVR